MTEKKIGGGCFSHSPQDVQQDKSVKRWGERSQGANRKSWMEFVLSYGIISIEILLGDCHLDSHISRVFYMEP